MRIGVAALVTLLAASPAPSGPAARVYGAVAALAAQRHGTIAFDLQTSYVERGPGHDVTRETEQRRLTQDGRLVAIRLVRAVENGRVASAADLAKRQADLDQHLPAADYRLPVDAGELSEYRFADAACDGCAAGQTAVAFTSLQRDDEHGDGTMVFDARGRIVRLAFAPSAMPSHVDRASIVADFGPVLPDLWDETAERQRYDGHVFVFHGYGEVKYAYTRYRRYASLDEGRAALAALAP